jgi:hypothetical protein
MSQQLPEFALNQMDDSLGENYSNNFINYVDIVDSHHVPILPRNAYSQF